LRLSALVARPSTARGTRPGTNPNSQILITFHVSRFIFPSLNHQHSTTDHHMTEEQQLIELRTTLAEFKGGWAQIRNLPAVIKTLQEENDELRGHVTKLRKEVLTLAQRNVQPIRKHEVVTHDCARYL